LTQSFIEDRSVVVVVVVVAAAAVDGFYEVIKKCYFQIINEHIEIYT
jgi:hypothetical protein